jgi:Protein of unknown function (DUF2905)
MLRWFIVIFLALVLIAALRPLLDKLGLGRLPGDIRFTVRGREVYLPVASTVLLSFVASLIGYFV